MVGEEEVNILMCSMHRGHFGIDVAIFAAAMGLTTGPELAAAVSNAGGLGLMSFSGNPPPVLRGQIRRLRPLTNQPFGVNVLLSRPRTTPPPACPETTS